MSKSKPDGFTWMVEQIFEIPAPHVERYETGRRALTLLLRQHAKIMRLVKKQYWKPSKGFHGSNDFVVGNNWACDAILIKLRKVKKGTR